MRRGARKETPPNGKTGPAAPGFLFFGPTKVLPNPVGCLPRTPVVSVVCSGQSAVWPPPVIGSAPRLPLADGGSARPVVAGALPGRLVRPSLTLRVTSVLEPPVIRDVLVRSRA